MEENTEIVTTGADKFLKSSDELLGRAADFLDKCSLEDLMNLEHLREVCEIVKITAASIKALREDEDKKKNEETNEKKSGSRVDRKADQRRSE